MQGIVLSFLVALCIAVIAIPSIIRVSYLKHLYDVPDERKSHSRVIPTLGGLAIFAGFTISTCLFSPNEAEFLQYKYLFASVLIIFFIGIKDDILITAPIKKLIGQILAALILVLLGGIKITSLYGLLGIYEIEEGWQVLLTTFTLLVIMNGFNLIDGINWLSGGVAIVAASSFGFWFYINNFLDFAIISSSLAGAVVGFLWFNKTPARIFMGDTGSLIIGLVIGVLCIQFIEMNEFATKLQLSSIPVVTFGILVVPLFDTLRVFIWRVLKGNSPLHPDQNHIHHRLLELGWSHMKSSIVIMIFNLGLVILLFKIHNYFDSLPLLFVVLFIAGFGSFLPSLILRFKNKKTIKQVTLKAVPKDGNNELNEAS